jgi:hypothetical protein|tara:strand:- start:261 stop:467 length:207 start_codon:yes stop_codon:yes gene_type:complete
MKYKAKKEFSELKDKFFGPHKIQTLENGGVVNISTPKDIPSKVLSTLEVVGNNKKPNKVVKETTKGDK